ncbi:MAG TPA: ATP-binding protein [Acetobacteraceae bacterium]|nr:ATP-binding protein [Acetobacteraceae bacterium]
MSAATPAVERLRALLESEAAALAVLDTAGCILRANQGFARLVGEHRSALAGRDPVSLFMAEDQAVVAAAIGEALRRRTAPAIEARLLAGAADPDAAAEVFCRPLRDEAGALLRLTDVTERRQLQSQLAAASRMQAVGQLAGGVAHDFNNLLGTMSGAAEAALARTTDPAAAADLRQVLDSAARAAGLVRQLLAFASAQPMEPRAVDLPAAIAKAEPLLRRLLGGGVRLELALDAAVPPVRLDPSQLDQVLLNLTANARDAMDGTGGLRIAVGAVTLARREAGVTGPVPAGQWVVLDVSDTGPGIPAAMQRQVFEPFFTTRRGRGGTGLGLSTVLGIIRQSGGHLSLRSAPGQGTWFRLWLPPLDGSAPAPPPEPEARVGPVARRGRILLVDDEAPLRALTRRALESAGHQVTDAEGPEAALASLDACRPDLLVSDVVLGTEDGVALAGAARARCPGLKVLLVSGYAESVLARDLSAEGIGFLAKPYRMAELLAAVDRALGAAE